MMNTGKLIELALGAEEARKVDTAIPQAVFDRMTLAARASIAGWYYAPEAKLSGRLLTVDECWQEIRRKIEINRLRAMMLDNDVTYISSLWPCFRQHVMRGEITLEEVK